MCSVSCDGEQEKEGNKVGIHQYDLFVIPQMRKEEESSPVVLQCKENQVQCPSVSMED